MEQTRYGEIRNKDLSDWHMWHDATKDRYDEVYEELGFWRTLDSKAVALTFRWWSLLGLGVVLRVLFALLGSNRYEPFPIGNWKHFNTMWPDDPDWLRWLKWHLRNPWCDLRKFYLGFGYAMEVEHVEKSWGRVHWARFAVLSFALPFPEWKTRYLEVGWEKRGILSASL